MGINTLSDSLGQSGGPIEWVCTKGNKYKVSLMTLEKQSEFERLLEKKAIESVRNHKDILEKEEYTSQIQSILESIKNGEFVFGGKKSSDALRTVWGISALLSILAGITQNEASVLIAENEEIPMLIETVVERSFPVSAGKFKAMEKKT